MRLDQYLVSKGYFSSREKALRAIKGESVFVNNKLITKPAFDVNESDNISVNNANICPYVSVGGLKLERAINYFNLDFKDKIVLDIGSSTGGFTDCALAHGAKLCYSVDVGKNQLDTSLRYNPKVKVFEETNILDFNTDVIFDYLVMDVSFISITKIIPHIMRFLNKKNMLVCLIKPQFEVGTIKLKNGVVKDKNKHKEVIDLIHSFIHGLGIYINDLTYSTQKGKTGNIEYLIIVSKNPICKNYDISKVVNESHEM